MVDTVKEMGVGLKEANTFAVEVFNYEKRIAEVISLIYLMFFFPPVFANTYIIDLFFL